ncbi:MAG: Chromosome partition protein Smc [Phycisphaerae bacterium]|nr:Chromosome partition protein Smc [Phycisphaerae bacterium]
MEHDKTRSSQTPRSGSGSSVRPTSERPEREAAGAGIPRGNGSGAAIPPRATEGTERESADGRRSPKPLHDTFLDERNDVLSVINELENQLDRYEDLRASSDREVKELTEKSQGLTQRNQELEWQVVTLQTRLDAVEQVREEIALLEEEVTAANQRSSQLQEQAGAAEKDIARLNGELKTANRQLEEFWATRKERDGLKVDYQNLRARAAEAEQSVREMSEERTQLSAQLQEAQIGLEEMRTARAQAELTARANEDRIREMQRTAQALEEKVETLRDEKRNLMAQLTHTERENARLVEQRHTYECELNSARNMNRMTEAALASVKKAFAEVRIALVETKARTRRRTSDQWTRAAGTLKGIEQRRSGDATPEVRLEESEELATGIE